MTIGQDQMAALIQSAMQLAEQGNLQAAAWLDAMDDSFWSPEPADLSDQARAALAKLDRHRRGRSR